MQHTFELDTLTAEHKLLVSTIADLKSTQTRQTSTLSDLRRAHTLAETDNARLKRELDVALQPIRAHAEESKRHAVESERWGKERGVWEAKCLALSEEVKRVQGEAGREREGQKARDGQSERENRALRERVEGLVGLVGMLSAIRAGATEAMSDTRDEEEELARLRLRGAEWRMDGVAMDLKFERETVKMLENRLVVSEQEREMLAGMVDEMVRRKHDTASDWIPREPTDDMMVPHDPAETREVLSLTAQHIDIATSYFTRMLDDEQDTTTSLRLSIEALEPVQADLSRLRTTHDALQASHIALQTAHEPCFGQITELRKCVQRVSQIEVEVNAELAQVRGELTTLEYRARQDREALRRVNEGTLRWKSAEAALEEEIDSWVLVWGRTADSIACGRV